MTDIFEPDERSRIMARVKNRNTKPELIVKSALLELNIRYRLNYKKIPCKPDFIFPGRKKAVFVHGCFWHGHHNCKRAKLPETNHEFWKNKIDKNKIRDEQNQINLEKLGWSCLVIWQCELKDTVELNKRLEIFINS